MGVEVHTSELSGAHGALKIVDAAGSDKPDTYFLLWDEAERLFRHELTPEEFFPSTRINTKDALFAMISTTVKPARLSSR